MIKLLLEHGANANLGSLRYKITPFHCICRNIQVTYEIIELFLDHNGNPNKGNVDNETPFHCIYYKQKVTVELIGLFLKHSADPNTYRGFVNTRQLEEHRSMICVKVSHFRLK